MNPPIRTAVLGLGRAGWQAIQVLGCRAHAKLDTMLKGTAVELVVVATPSHLKSRR